MALTVRTATLVAILTACSGARGGITPPATCSPDTAEDCTCEGGGSGTRTCQSDGTFGACACPGQDATVAMDAVANDLPAPDLTAPDRGVTCTAPRLDCDGNPANGCETDTASSASHCGRCSNPCPAGRSCVSGVCASASCASGQTSCGGACVNLQTDARHCGACGNVCPAGNTCTAGRCAPPAGMCPSSCRNESDCAPCRTPGDPGNYCCISGLCLYMTGACGPVGGADSGPTGGGDASPDTSGG
jgi:hypothetical protein